MTLLTPAAPDAEADGTRASSRRRIGGWRDAAVVAGSRTVAILGVIALVGALPWLSSEDPAYTVLRARYAEREATPDALAAIREEIGLDGGPVRSTLSWLGGVLHGDFGRSWVSNDPVGASTFQALGISLTLMGFALLIALVVAALVLAPTLRAGLKGRQRYGSGLGSVTLTALPEFLLSVLLLLVVAVWWGWLPPYGWNGIDNAILPALALGLPAGGLIGRLLTSAVVGVFAERWLVTWRAAGFGSGAIVLAVLRRALPSVTGQIGLVVVGLTGGAVAVEKVFAIPGLGRALLGSATAQDLPALQAGLVMLLAVALLTGGLAALARRLLLGRAMLLGNLPVPEPVTIARRRDLWVPLGCGIALLVLIAAGLPRDPYDPSHGRLTAPSWSLPFGADATGRDVLARVGHGALLTVGIAVIVVAVCLLLGLVIGSAPRASTGFAEVTNATPPVLAGLIVAAITGPSLLGAAVAVAIVSWAPLATHTAALVLEARAQPHIAVLPVLGVGRVRRLFLHILPAVIPVVARHAALRLPGVVLAIAGLGFLGLGASPPSPEWGLMLSDGVDYLERAPWVSLAPTLALVLVSVLATSLAGLVGVRRVRAPRASRRSA